MLLVLVLISSASALHNCEETLLDNTVCPISIQNTLSITPEVESVFECQNLCRQVHACSHFTLYTLTDPEVSSCALLRSCNTSETTTCSTKPDSVISPCKSAVSGPRTPTIDKSCCSVFESRACDGNIISQLFNVSSPDECQRLCKQSEGCKYFTQYSNNFCFLHTACDKSEPCNVCTSGPRSPSLSQCKESVSQITLLIGGITGTQGSHSTNMEMVTEHLSCTPLMPEPPIALHRASAVLFGSTIMYCGGESSIVPKYSPECFSYLLDEPRTSWQQMASMNHPRNEFTMETFDGQVFAIGGVSDWGVAVTGTSVEVFTPGEGWVVSEEMQMPNYRSCHCSAVIDTRLIIIGGDVGGASYSKDVRQFDFSAQGKGWTSLQATKYGHQYHACQVGSFQGQQGIYVIGGSNSGHKIVEFWVDSVNMWRTLPSLSIDRYHHTSSFMGDKLFVHGGGDNAAKSTQESFNRTWANSGNIRDARHHHASVMVPEYALSCTE